MSSFESDLRYVIDADSTLFTVESLDELARTALEGRPDQDDITAEVQAITEQGMRGLIGFDESLQRRLELFNAHWDHVEALSAQLAEQVSPSALANTEWFKENADRIYVISGGFDDYMFPALGRLGLSKDQVYANRFVYDDSGTIMGYDEKCLLAQPQGKVKLVDALQISRPLIVIGDGMTDLEIKTSGRADQFWAYTETVRRQEVIDGADRVLTSFFDL